MNFNEATKRIIEISKVEAGQLCEGSEAPKTLAIKKSLLFLTDLESSNFSGYFKKLSTINPDEYGDILFVFETPTKITSICIQDYDIAVSRGIIKDRTLTWYTPLYFEKELTTKNLEDILCHLD